MVPFSDDPHDHRVLPDLLSQQLMFTVAYHKHSPLCGRCVNHDSSTVSVFIHGRAVRCVRIRGLPRALLRPDIGRRKLGQNWMRCGTRGLHGEHAGAGRVPYPTFFEAWPWGEYKGSLPDALPMYDIHPSPDVAHCNGSLCREAAAVVDDFIRMQVHRIPP